MAIVAHELLRDEDIGGSKRLVIARYQDNSSKWHPRSWTGPITDAAQYALDAIPQVEIDLADLEIDEAIARAAAGNNPDLVPPVHQSQVDFDRRLVGRLMAETDIDLLIAALPFWTSRETSAPPGWGTNNNARADFLGVPRPEYIECDGRFGDLQGVAGGVNTVNAQVWDEVKDAWL